MYKTVCLVLLVVGLAAARQANQAGLDLIKKFEPFHADFFVNPNGLKVIGYGHICVSNECSKIFPPINETVGEELLKEDLVKSEDCVQEYVPFVNDNQFAALVSLTSTIGCSPFKASTLSAEILARDYTDAAHEFRTFVHGNKGKIDPELIKRRAAEEELFLKK